MGEQFLPWRRSAVYDLADPASVGQPRLTAKLQLRLADLDDPGQVRDGRSPFQILGPGDVAGLLAGAVTARVPGPGTPDAEQTKSVQMEFAAPDLPWRYSPCVPEAADGLRPWLVLVVGTPEEVVVGADGTVRLTGQVLTEHRLADSYRWAHVHDHDNRPVARLLSPRGLPADSEQVAALVPAFTVTPGGIAGDSWQPETPTVQLRCYDHWRFRTGPLGDFASLAGRLQPVQASTLGPTFGVAEASYGPLPDERVFGVPAALIRPPGPGEEVPSPPTPAVTTDLAELTSGPTVAPDGRWILTLPDYGAPWPAGAVAGPDGWRQQLASDPRTRGVAGLGAWAGIEWQDRIADAAATQAAALAIASQRIRHLTFGLSATRSLWRNRFLPLGSGIMQLWCLGPSMRRLPAGNSSVLDAVDGRTPLLVRELFSTSLRRVMRRGSALANLAAPDATAPAAVLDAANRCPGPRRPPRLRDELDHPPHEPGELALSDQDRAALLALARPLPRQPPPCRPVDLDLLGSRVAAAVDPTGPRPLVVDRVLGTITGLVEPVLAPPEIEPELDIPMWKFLDDYQRDWLLPGVGLLPRDAVTAVQSNPAFVDAFLVGANVQTVGELRWRNIPITTGWTPLRRFWLRIGGPPPGGPATDITGVKFWAETSGLGDASHLPDPGAGANLVVVFRTDLFRRYPTTLVYLAQINPPDDWVNLPPVDDPDFHRVNPTFTGAIGADVVFFGFPVEPAQGRDHWVVLEEPPHGPRFNANPPTSVPDNGAGYAHTAFAKPVRVFLGKVM